MALFNHKIKRVANRFRFGRDRFRRDQRGATAVEFALIALPFFTLFLMILEVGFIFWIGQSLDHATARAARLIRTGEAHQQGYDSAKFRDEVCANVGQAFNCKNALSVEVQKYDQFAAVNLANLPVDADGNIVGPLPYDMGGREEIIVVRTYYTWDLITDFTGILSNAGGGKRVLVSTITFRNEPFS